MRTAQDRCRDIYPHLLPEELQLPIKLLTKSLAIDIRDKYWRMTGVKLTDEECQALVVQIVKRGVRELL